jgi:hypothetical protein
MDFEPWGFDLFSSSGGKRTTSAQWVVIAWSAIVLLVGFGAVALYVAWRLPAAELQDAVTLRRGAFTAFGIAAGIYVAKRVAQRIFDA